ncbi:hypothetical protein ABW21_db0209145 [Orbilia brochopaga]|nr:hypothetical protein ABW21_db0209145 [Drechslerella brochopaga]
MEEDTEMGGVPVTEGKEEEEDSGAEGSEDIEDSTDEEPEEEEEGGEEDEAMAMDPEGGAPAAVAPGGPAQPPAQQPVAAGH